MSFSVHPSIEENKTAIARSSRSAGIYVEILMNVDLERLWQYTQHPALHQQWDLRFSSIEYLPRPLENEPQRFLYSTRIGFGRRISGQGESAGTRESSSGVRISGLKFWSQDPMSLIEEGSGYWRYVPVSGGIRFLTWYDYRTRFGLIGKMVDRLLFRPLLGWATAWSFDRLRLWLERDISPQISLRLAAAHFCARVAIAFIWLWHGLLPKLLFHGPNEQAYWLPRISPFPGRHG